MRQQMVRHLSTVLMLGLVAATTACGGTPGKKASATVTVTVPAATNTDTTEQQPPPPKQATVAVLASGFSQDGSNASYGVVLKNPSQTEDALDVEVSINFVDRSGT